MRPRSRRRNGLRFEDMMSIEAATNQGQRKDYYVQFQRIFAEETPALIIAYPIYTYAVDKSVRDVQIGPMVSPADRFLNIADWYIHTRRVILAEAQHQTPTD